jgi:hypothetical protein
MFMFAIGAHPLKILIAGIETVPDHVGGTM